MPPYNIAVANILAKELFRLSKSNFSATNKLYKIFNKNTVKLSYNCMPNVAYLINKSNTKNLNNKQHINFPRCNCINKAACLLKDKCQYECIVYKVEVHSSGPKNCNRYNNSCNGKIVYVGPTLSPKILQQ